MDLLCPLNERLSISAFDSGFGESYRETTFLSHPLVPKSVSGSISPVFLIETDLAKSRIQGGNLSVPTFVKRLRPFRRRKVSEYVSSLINANDFCDFLVLPKGCLRESITCLQGQLNRVSAMECTKEIQSRGYGVCIILCEG